MLSGGEDALRRRALAQLMAEMTKESDFDLETFEAGESRPLDWIASAGTAPFLGERRTVVVRRLVRAEDPAEAFGMEKPTISLPDRAFLVLVVDEEPGDDNKQRRHKGYQRAWEKVVASSGGYVARLDIDAAAIKGAIKKEAAEQGKKLTSGALERLVEMTGSSLSRALEEMEKLVLYVGNEQQIGEADVRAAVVPSREWYVFKLVQALVEGNVAEALRQLRSLVGSNTKAEEAAYRNIFPVLSKQLRLLWQARLCIDAKTVPKQAPDDVAAAFPERPNIRREADWLQARAMTAARTLSLDQIARCFQLLCDADGRLKGQLPSFTGMETLERMVLEMAETVRPGAGQPIGARG